jgi:glucosamine-6-phosphate deaminase
MSIPALKIYEYCSIPAEQLEEHPLRKIPLRIIKDSAEMGELMAKTLIDEIAKANEEGRECRAIIPCGPKAWYVPFTRMINERRVSMKRMTVFHMDECLDWNGDLLPENHPSNFKAFMEKNFHGGIPDDLCVPVENRIHPNMKNIHEIREKIEAAPIDILIGGWGQDGHIAYNQANRNPFVKMTIDELRNLSIRVQENNIDTIMSYSQRELGSAYQLVAPMYVTLGIKECLSAKKIRLFSDTGSWKATALRVALFGDITPEYPMTLLQEHPDALLTATIDTARHPVSEHPEWKGAWG